jgi:phenylpyruvate tautomerase PptA (4-oxalocrotonate tautomerase family)
MAHVKIYKRRDTLSPGPERTSSVIHECMMEVLHIPEDKRFHRFLRLDSGDFIFSSDRSEEYTVIEIIVVGELMAEVKKTLIHRLYDRFESDLHIRPKDLEITIFELPRYNWGLRGVTGDELDQVNDTQD